MKKLLFVLVMVQTSLRGVDNDFPTIIGYIHKALQEYQEITDPEQRLKQWKTYYNFLHNLIPNNKEQLEALLIEAENKKCSHPVFHFLVHVKRKKLNKPKRILQMLSLLKETIVGKKSTKCSELTSESLALISESLPPTTNEQLKTFVIQAAQNYNVMLPHTNFAKAVWNKKIKVKKDIVEYSPLKNTTICLLSGNRFSIKPNSVDLHYLSCLPQQLKISLGFFNALKLTMVPEDVSRLEQLKALNLCGNELTDLPKSLSQLKQLKALGIGNNKFSQIPEVISKLEKLETLAAHQNQLSKDPSDVISKTTSLQHLDLSNNNLTCFTLQKLPGSFKSLNLDNNYLADLPIAQSFPHVNITYKNNLLVKGELVEFVNSIQLEN